MQCSCICVWCLWTPAGNTPSPPPEFIAFCFNIVCKNANAAHPLQSVHVLANFSNPIVIDDRHAFVLCLPQDNYNVLHIASMYSREDVVKLLLSKRGVDPFSTGGVSTNNNIQHVEICILTKLKLNSHKKHLKAKHNSYRVRISKNTVPSYSKFDSRKRLNLFHCFSTAFKNVYYSRFAPNFYTRVCTILNGMVTS